MRLSCPSCGAEYDLPETLFLTGPRKVRCVKCAHSWMAGERQAEPAPGEPPPAPAAEPAAPAVAEDAAAEAGARRPLPLRRRAAAPEAPPPRPELALVPPEPPGSGRAVMVAWVASIAILAGACWAGWTWREAVMQAWPASTHLFAALGG